MPFRQGFERRNLVHQKRIGKEPYSVVDRLVADARPKHLGDFVFDIARTDSLPRVAAHAAECLFQNAVISSPPLWSRSQVVNERAFDHGTGNQVAEFLSFRARLMADWIPANF